MISSSLVRQPKKSFLGYILAIVALLVLGYILSNQFFKPDPNAAANGRKSFFLLDTSVTIDKSPASACNPQVTQYTVNVEVFHEASKGLRSKGSFTIPANNEAYVPNPLKLLNPDPYFVASKVGAAYYRAYYKIEAKDVMGKVLATKTGIQGPYLAADTQTPFTLNFFCTLGQKPTPTPYPISTSFRVNTAVTVTLPSTTSTTKSCNPKIAYYIATISPYHAAAGSLMNPRTRFQVPVGITTTTALVTLQKYLVLNRVFDYTNLYMAFSIDAYDAKGARLFSFPSGKPGITWTKEKYRFVKPPGVTEAKLTFDCNLETAN